MRRPVFILLSFLFALRAQAPQDRENRIRQFLPDLEVENRRGQAIYDLGALRATEAVPALLRLLEAAPDETSTHTDRGNGVSEWVVSDPRASLVDALGRIGDGRAIPALERLLRTKPESTAVRGGWVATALYLITGKSYTYTNFEGEARPLAIQPNFSLERRKIAREYLKPVAGLTLAVAVSGNTLDYWEPEYAWSGADSVTLTLSIQNHTPRSIRIDLSPGRLTFLVNGVTSVSAADLPSSSALPTVETVPARRMVTHQWTIPRLSASPIAANWTTGGKFFWAQLTTPKSRGNRSNWSGPLLESNPTDVYYFAPPATP